MLLLAVEGRSDSGNWKWHTSSTKLGITNKSKQDKYFKKKRENADYD
jgi:hypothetical protein